MSFEEVISQALYVRLPAKILDQAQVVKNNKEDSIAKMGCNCPDCRSPTTRVDGDHLRLFVVIFDNS